MKYETAVFFFRIFIKKNCKLKKADTFQPCSFHFVYEKISKFLIMVASYKLVTINSGAKFINVCKF